MKTVGFVKLQGSNVGHKLENKKAPLLGDRATLFGPAIECCGAFMRLSSELPNTRADGLTSLLPDDDGDYPI